MIGAPPPGSLPPSATDPAGSSIANPVTPVGDLLGFGGSEGDQLARPMTPDTTMRLYGATPGPGGYGWRSPGHYPNPGGSIRLKQPYPQFPANESMNQQPGGFQPVSLAGDITQLAQQIPIQRQQPAPGAQSDEALAARGQQETQKLPFGAIPVQEMRLLPHYNGLGATRPLGPGEAVRLPDGGITSEETYTAQLPSGKWAVIPGLWLVNGVPTHVTEDQAAHLAATSGLEWPYTFDTPAQGDAYAVQREAVWEKTPQALDMTTAQPPLWRQRQ